MTEPTVTAVIVTYNRLNLLKSAIRKVLNQNSESLKHVVIVDGASTDGTREYLDMLDDERVLVHHLSENLGGAGGFNYGIRQFYEQTMDDFVWVMDDDSMPQTNALTELLRVFEVKKLAGWAASKVVWIDGEWSYMNLPAPLSGAKNSIQISKDKLIPIKHATFVSTIYKRELIECIGLPQKEYFIWGDDIEFTERAARELPGYFANQSIVIHESQVNAKPGDIVGEESSKRLPRYLYEYRNRLLTARRRQSLVKFCKTLAHTGLDFLRTMFGIHVIYRRQKLWIIIRGTINGFSFNPKVEYVSQKHIDNE